MRWVIFLLLAISGNAAYAASTTTYSYDALGRLIDTAVSGGPCAGTQSDYALDAAGNRTNLTVSGASCKKSAVVVVPLNGLTIIPVQVPVQN